MRRLAQAVVALVIVGLAGPAAAQSARAIGQVRDLNGRPIKGATVRAVNQDAFPPEITSATDSKGRWAMIGLRTATWRFVVEAPGFVTSEATLPVRVGSTPPFIFSLARDPGPVPGALDRNIASQLGDAGTLRDQGRLDQALDAYEEIRDKNPKLTAVHLVMADVYRQKAARETDAAARAALLDRAIGAYTALLESDAEHARARSELDATRAERMAISPTGR